MWKIFKRRKRRKEGMDANDNTHNGLSDERRRNVHRKETTKESWRAVSGFSRYWVSNMGRVKSIWRPNEKILKAYKTKGCPYSYVSLVGEDKKAKSFAVRELVYETFVGPIPSGKRVFHADGDAENFMPDNLRLTTQTYGVAFAE